MEDNLISKHVLSRRVVIASPGGVHRFENPPTRNDRFRSLPPRVGRLTPASLIYETATYIIVKV